MAAPRLFVAAPLDCGSKIALSDAQSRYLSRVLRMQSGDEVRLFNGCDGEFLAEIAEAGANRVGALVRRQLKPFQASPPIRLLFAPLKRQATDWLVEKATELGVSELRPVRTRRTVAERVRVDRLAMIALEAAEQCERLEVPKVLDSVPLGAALADWDVSQPLLFADEASHHATSPAPPSTRVLSELPRTGALAVLIGPEGGFEPEERRWLHGLPFVLPVSLGPRILRAETAAIVALGLVQSLWGDWLDPL